MKKRIFTLLALVTVLGSVFSVTNAQKVANVYIEAIGGGQYREIDTNVSDLVKVSDSVIMGTYGATKLTINVNDADKIDGEAVVELRYDGVAGYLGLPDTVLIKKATTSSASYSIDVDGGWNFPQSMNGGIVSISAKIKGSKDDFTAGNHPWVKSRTVSYGVEHGSYALYRPFFTLDYHPITSTYEGSLFVKYTGIPYGSIDTDERWIGTYFPWTEKKGTRDSIHLSFTPAQIYDLDENDTIVVRTTLQATSVSASNTFTYLIPVYNIIHEEEIDPNPILRNVKVAQLTDASIDKPNSFQWKSTTDLPIILTLKGDNVGKIPELKTDRKTFTGNGEELGVTWTREKNADGTYTITIIRVQENFTIGFDFKEDPNSNDVIDQNNNVWSANGQLYVTSAVAANAKVYTATGALVKTITLAAGETANASLSAGFYIVTLGDNSYKVVVR